MYAQQDRTPAQQEADRLSESSDYQQGVEMGWKLAEAFHMVSSTQEGTK